MGGLRPSTLFSSLKENLQPLKNKYEALCRATDARFVCSGSDSVLCTFRFSQKMLTNMSHHFCNMLRRSAACRTICHVSLRRRVFAQTAPLSKLLKCCEASGWLRTLTSPRGPGSLTRPALRWCRVCRHIPGCCVCSEPPSSGTPDSSCPAGTCSTIRQPPSRRTLCRLRHTTIRVATWGTEVDFQTF